MADTVSILSIRNSLTLKKFSHIVYSVCARVDSRMRSYLSLESRAHFYNVPITIPPIHLLKHTHTHTHTRTICSRSWWWWWWRRRRSSCARCTSFEGFYDTSLKKVIATKAKIYETEAHPIKLVLKNKIYRFEGLEHHENLT